MSYQHIYEVPGTDGVFSWGGGEPESEISVFNQSSISVRLSAMDIRIIRDRVTQNFIVLILTSNKYMDNVWLLYFFILFD